MDNKEAKIIELKSSDQPAKTDLRSKQVLDYVYEDLNKLHEKITICIEKESKLDLD